MNTDTRMKLEINTDAECMGAISLILKTITSADTPGDITRPEWAFMKKIAESIEYHLAESGFGYDSDAFGRPLPADTEETPE